MILSSIQVLNNSLKLYPNDERLCGAHEITVILEDVGKRTTRKKFLLTVHSPPKFEDQIPNMISVRINFCLYYSLPLSQLESQ